MLHPGFPVELLDIVTQELLWLIGPQKLLRLRTTSQIFDAAILRAICSSYVNNLKDCQDPFHRWLEPKIKKGVKLSPPIMGRLIFAQMKIDPENKILHQLRITLERVIPQVFTRSSQPNAHALHICEAAADSLSWKISPTVNEWELIHQSRSLASSENESLVEKPLRRKIKWIDLNILCTAIVIGDMVQFQKSLQKSIHFTSSDYFGYPLQLAARWGCVEMLELLLEKGAITVYIQNDRPPAVQRFLQHYAQFYSTDGSALRVACLAGHVAIVHVLMMPQHRTGLPESEFFQAIRAAGRGGHLNIIQLLLSPEHKIVRILPKSWPNDLLLEASKHGQPAVVQYLISNFHADPNYTISRYPTSLQLAAAKGHASILKILLDSGAKKNFLTNPYKQNCPIEASIRRGYLKCLQILLDCGLDIAAYEPSHFLLGLAANSCQLETLKLLIKNGANLHKRGKNGTSTGEVLLHQAVARGREPVIRLLLELGVNPNCEDQKYDAVLTAMVNDRDDILKVLLQLGGKHVNVSESIFASEFAAGYYPVRSVYRMESMASDRSLPAAWLGRDF
ncbi:ankyrin repeat-containing domain protein [Tricladium varicosporioides]|nr:ankyrin repeat-containing domain protein [Hymenoscyphus varicosporioides]